MHLSDNFLLHISQKVPAVHVAELVQSALQVTRVGFLARVNLLVLLQFALWHELFVAYITHVPSPVCKL